MTRNELIERAITALVSVDSDSDIAKPMRTAIDEVTEDLDVREDVAQPAFELAAWYLLDQPAPDGRLSTLRWGAKAHVDGLIQGMAIAIAAAEREGTR